MTSFEFTWNGKGNSKVGKSSGKVFAKKKNKIVSEAADSTKSNFFLKQSVKRQASDLDSNAKKTKDIVNDGTKLESPKFIKRKSKKDKQATINNTLSLNTEDKTSKGPNTNHQQSATTHRSLFSEKYKNVYINTDLKGKSVVEKVFSAGKKISDLEIHKHLLSNLEKNNFNILTNVQEKSIPKVLSGQNVLIRSQTGSGKTLTYAVPMLNALVNITPRLQRSDGVQAIIVVPTRELALQTHELFGKLNTFQWIVVGYLCGGENRKTEKVRLKKGVHILIGTPGRLLDHILHTTAFNAKHVRCLVLDEADRLLDMGFKKDIVRLVEELDSQKKSSSYDPMAILRGQKSEEETIPEKRSSSNIPPLQDTNSNVRQTILLSATLTKGIAELADFTMQEHVYVDALDESSTVNPEHLIIPNTVKQEFILTFVKHRLVMLSALLITASKRSNKTFIFMATSHMVDFHYDLFKNYLLKMPKNKGKMRVGNVLLLDEVELDDSDEEEEDVLDIELFKLHGSMSQNERKEVFNGFREAQRGVLLCTDVVARGIDVPEAESIIQYTGPQTIDDYIHRVGRTGRAGKSGSALIFLAHEEQEFVSRLQEHKVFLKEHKSDDLLANLTVFMEETDHEKATLALQRRYESAISKDKELHKKACFAYSSWSRFYSSFPSKMRTIFDFKKVNQGHFVTSFGLQDTPTVVAKAVRGQVTKVEAKRLNRKLANHETNEEVRKPPKKRLIKSLSLATSEFSSGLEPAKKKKKKLSHG